MVTKQHEGVNNKLNRAKKKKKKQKEERVGIYGDNYEHRMCQQQLAPLPEVLIISEAKGQIIL